MKDLVRIAPQDLVAVALRPLRAGETVAADGELSPCGRTFPWGTRLLCGRSGKGKP